MGSYDPEDRVRQLAELRAAYQSRSGFPDDPAGRGTARHAMALLERILVVLGGLPEDPDLQGRGAGKASPRI